MSQANLKLVREMISAVNERDLDRYLAHCTDNIELHTPWAAVEGVYEGRDAIRRFFSDLRDTVPDFRLTIERLEPIGPDRVLGFLQASGTGRASGMPAGAGVPSATAGAVPAATPGAVPTANIYDLADGKISRIRIFLDRDEALEAAGPRD
jgi:ketosteroid isomerase-like protein